MYQMTDPQGQLTKSIHNDYFNQMQQLGDALSKKGDDFDDDPDPERMNDLPNVHRTLSNSHSRQVA